MPLHVLSPAIWLIPVTIYNSGHSGLAEMVEFELHSHCGEAASESLAPICTFGHIQESPSHSHLAEGQAQTQKLASTSGCTFG